MAFARTLAIFFALTVSPAPRARVSFEEFARLVVQVGGLNRVPGLIAQRLDVTPDHPIHWVEVTESQATDGLFHEFKSLVKVAKDQPPEPVGVLLLTYFSKDGRDESRWYRVSLDGTLEKAFVIRGKVDAQRKGVKGSGTAEFLDVASPDTRKRFQHELDLWLKRAHLKKEWRSAEFSEGALKKMAKRQ